MQVGECSGAERPERDRKHFHLRFTNPRERAGWHPLSAACSAHRCSTARHGTPTSNMKFYNVSLVWLPLRLGLNLP